MTDEQYKKQKFITHELLELLKAMHREGLSYADLHNSRQPASNSNRCD